MAEGVERAAAPARPHQEELAALAEPCVGGRPRRLLGRVVQPAGSEEELRPLVDHGRPQLAECHRLCAGGATSANSSSGAAPRRVEHGAEQVGRAAGSAAAIVLASAR